ncbi:MAG TPA: sigma-70 family RNA polymerase sigma factor [Verrucomicrobiae bacterium]|nr:sigma-70 family RNA polymerase sigma factor [Verrucomicrobiae bacterium]
MVEESEIQGLIDLAKQGDSNAFGRIYDLYADRMFNFLIFRVRHKETAEDLLHTTFLKAWTNLKSYTRQNAKFSTWLFQIANFTLIDHWRTKKEVIDIDKVENISHFARDPVLFEEYSYLWDALAKLPDDQQTVLELRFKRDLSIKETAEIMNKSSVAIRVMQHRALKNLRKNLKRQGLM